MSDQMLDEILGGVLSAPDGAFVEIEGCRPHVEDLSAKPEPATETPTVAVVSSGRGKPHAKRSITKSQLSVVKRSLKIKRVSGKGITSFMEAPPSTQGGPPTMLLVSPVPPEQFLEYFTKTLWPFALQAVRQAEQLRIKGVGLEAARINAERNLAATNNAVLPVTMVYPEIETHVFPADKNSKPVFVTPLHAASRNL